MTRVIAASATTGALALTGGPAAGLAWGGDEGGFDHFGRDRQIVVVCRFSERREFRDDFSRFRSRDRCLVIRKESFRNRDWGGDGWNGDG
jgi:hypothetical protein